MHRQGDLLGQVTSANAKLMPAQDCLYPRFGHGTVNVATQVALKNWGMCRLAIHMTAQAVGLRCQWAEAAIEC